VKFVDSYLPLLVAFHLKEDILGKLGTFCPYSLSSGILFAI